MHAATLWFNRCEMPRHSQHSIRRARAISRVVAACAGVVIGVFYGSFIISNSPGVFQGNDTAVRVALAATAIAWAAVLALAAPRLSVDPFLWLEDIADRSSPSELIGGIIGLVIALVIAALVGVLLSPLPLGIGMIVSLALACVLVYVGVGTGTRRRQVVGQLLSWRAGGKEEEAPAATAISEVLVDTSVLIDGRIIDVARSGFLIATLVIPTFVVAELQRLADSGDEKRRAKGKRGLDVTEQLNAMQEIHCSVVQVDARGTDVDAALLAAAHDRGSALMTTDYNLNRLAQVQGVRVLNLNALANAVKPVVSAGEQMRIAITKEGRELDQGVGYLEDGTMVVVEHAREHVGETVTATVTSVLQTPAGRMIFASSEERRPTRPARRAANR